ncbi:MAG: class I SAM-dependent methyltransferase [Acidobacteriota bacterium]
MADSVLAVRSSRASRHILDMGAGTGQIGQHLATMAPYIAIDRSLGMLAVFHDRSSACTVVADGTTRWPLADASVSVVFSSRAIHWLPPALAAHEIARVAAGGVLLIGRTRRDANDVRRLLRRALHRQLRDAGLEPRAGRDLGEALLALCRDGGAEDLEPIVAARWPATSRPSTVIAEWRDKPGLGGVASIDPTVKHRVLDAVTAWAKDNLGDIDRDSTAEDSYVLTGVRLPDTRP